ncbi:hypothetical protein VNO77_06796 [Canavalia gladiata]|uniref:Probable purine permease n=1 Tax=Canavalia gladiata TaxID=3824 RepID=A0AAN9QWA2_CANGL
MADGREGNQDRTIKKLLLVTNSLLLCIGSSAGPLVMRLYFIRGGHRVWLTSFLENAGFPVMFFPLAVSYIRRRRLSSAETEKPTIISMKPPVLVASVMIGILSGLDDYFYAYSLARLPVSTNALVVSTQLGFTAFFALVLVRQRFTVYSVNAVILLSIAAGILALHTSGDRPRGESTKEYVMGFVMTILAAALHGVILPLIELLYKKTKQPLTYSLVMEIQLVTTFFATLFCAVGMIVNNDFKVIPREARDFKHGEGNYYVVLVGSAILWQAFFMGAIGVIFCASSLLSGILIAVMLPVTEVLAVVFFKEKFQPEKGVSLLLSIWGFVSYFYGEIKQTTKLNSTTTEETELSRST